MVQRRLRVNVANQIEVVRQQVAAGTLPKSSAYEISKLSDDQTRTELAEKAAQGELSHAKTVKQINQRRGKRTSKPKPGLHLVFSAENGIKVAVARQDKASYHDVESALANALEEVRHRIENNVKLI